MSDLEPATAIEEALRGNSISAESVSFDDAVSLAYLTAFPDVKPDHGEVGHAVTSFLEHACDDEFELRTVEATVPRSEGDMQAMWTFEADWIHAYNDYAFDNEELFQRVLDSLYEEGDTQARDDTTANRPSRAARVGPRTSSTRASR